MFNHRPLLGLALLPALATFAPAKTPPVSEGAPIRTAAVDAHRPNEARRNAGNGFGVSVAMDGDRAFIGNPGTSPSSTTPPSRPGLLNVFAASGDGRWEKVRTVPSPTGEAGDGFGHAVAVSDRWLAVGAPGTAGGAGTAFVYAIAGDDLRLDFTIQVDSDPGDAFGSAVALSGNVLYVGAPGSRDGSGSVFAVELDAPYSVPSSILPAAPVPGGRFGSALSASPGRVLVGAPGPDAEGSGGPVEFLAGAAYVFTGSPAGMEEVAVLRAPGDLSAGLGWSVLLEGDDAFAGAPFGDGGAGAIHHFRREDEQWSHVGELHAGREGRAGLGMALAMSDSDLLAGAPYQGFVAVFHRETDGTEALTQIVEGAEAQTYFGSALAAESARAIAGAPAEGPAGAAGYVLARAEGEWAQATVLSAEDKADSR